jgi:hypothetical protein
MYVDALDYNVSFFTVLLRLRSFQMGNSFVWKMTPFSSFLWFWLGIDPLAPPHIIHWLTPTENVALESVWIMLSLSFRPFSLRLTFHFTPRLYVTHPHRFQSFSSSQYNACVLLRTCRLFSVSCLPHGSGKIPSSCTGYTAADL